MKKIFKAIFLTLLSFLALISISISILLFTSFGAKISLVILQSFTPNNITIKYKKISGSIYNGLNFKNIDIYLKNENKDLDKIISFSNNSMNFDFKNYNITALIYSETTKINQDNYTAHNLNINVQHNFNSGYTSFNIKTNNKENKENSILANINISFKALNEIKIEKFIISDNLNNFLKITNTINQPNKYLLNLSFNQKIENSDYDIKLITENTLNYKNSIFSSLNVDINYLKINYNQNNVIQLSNSKNTIVVTDTEISLNDTCFHLFDNKLCSRGNLNLVNNEFNLQGFSNNINLASFDKYIIDQKASINAETKLAFKINYNLNKDKSLNAKVNLDIDPGYITVANNKKTYNFKKSNVDITIIKNKLTSLIKLNLWDKDFITGSFNINDLLDLKSTKLSGSFQSRLSNLTPLGALLPDALNNLQGNLICNYNVSGNINNITGNGDCNLNAASFVLPNLNIKIINFNALAKISNNIIKFNASFESENNLNKTKNLGISNNGKLTINGQTNLNQEITTSLNIQGSNFLAQNTTNNVLYISPDINLNITPNDMKIDGKILIPKASFYSKDGSGSYDKKDVIFTDKNIKSNNKDEQSSLNISGDLKLIIENTIEFKMKNFTTDLAGSLNLKLKNNLSSPLVTGTLELKNGIYSIYDRNLKITKGILNYINNPIDNPLASIQAEKAINISGYGTSSLNRAYVGISLTGPLSSPKLTLISNPFMSKQDILSYLIFGAPSDNADKAQLSLLLTALQNVLGFSSTGNSFLGSVFNVFKLDEIKMESINTTDPLGIPTQNDQILVIGKKITDNLFVRYGFSLLDPLGLFQARYKISESWGFETNYDSFGQLSANLIYSKESN
tara:strand:- start:4006 stop:6570 length:2565 start_codon:yes stop_codon:yes gene_type:complete